VVALNSLRSEDRGAVRVVTLDNPQKRNALDFASLSELAAASQAASRDGVRCLVFRGEGDKAFCSGFDIAAIPVGPNDGDRPDLAVERTMEAVEAVPCPTIAFLNGSAFGAGAELAATCDLRVARPGVAIGMPPAKLGVVYAPAGLRRFLHLVGPSRAREMFFTGRPLEAGEALAIGLVDRVVPVDQAEEAALGLAQEIALNAPLAVQGMKRILRLLDAAAERGFTDVEREEIVRLRRRAFESDDVREGREAFLEKRPPRFRGR
jgi:enoyl-CoA hydratase